jgi:aspartate/glutamate racemase
MKRIGLLGGMSWESTIEYYRLVNELVAERLGGLHSADCLLRSVDFADIEVLQREDRWEEAGERLAEEARALELAGAELLVLCTNTMHRLAPEISRAISIPFVHIADTTADAVKRAQLTRVGLLATAYTMEQDFYVGRLRSCALLDRAGADIDALANIAVRVGALADAHPAIAELDLNPVMVGPDGAPVVDARVWVAPPAIQPVFPAVGR